MDHPIVCASQATGASPDVASQPKDWSHQSRAAELATNSLLAGNQLVAVCSPTGSGKTYIQSNMAKSCSRTGKRVVMLTNRRILLQQVAEQLDRDGVDYGVVSAEWSNYFDPFAPVQLCSIPTLWARKGRIHLPEADLVLIDEAHSNCRGEMSRGLIEHYQQSGAGIVGFTATPVGLGGLYQDLVIAARNSELISKQILVPCEVWAPNEPNMEGVKITNGEYDQGETEERVRKCTVFAQVYPHWHRINPLHKPTIMWAPGIDFSRWFVRQFNEHGVPSAHIDGNTPTEEREKIFAKFRSGELTMISSAGVLREGVDLREAECGLLLQPCRKIATFIQIAGRLLRSSPGKSMATLIDFSGAVWQHGSPTQDVDWQLEDTNPSVSKRCKEARKAKNEEYTVNCQQCHLARTGGLVCPRCGHKNKPGELIRFVREEDGTLTKRVFVTLPEVAAKAAIQRKWDTCFWACRNSKRKFTFKQVLGMYIKKFKSAPPLDLLRQPAPGSPDWKRPVKEVAEEWKKNGLTRTS